MKPEFPYINAHASIYIATPLLALTTIFLVTSVFTLSVQEVYPMVFSAFGITAALSGICYTVAASPTNEPVAKYAAEKFLHSSLLLMQSIAIIFVKSQVIQMSFIKSNTSLLAIFGVGFSILFTLLSTVAAWTFYHGFEDLNDHLWENYKRRIKNIREEIEKEKIKKKT